MSKLFFNFILLISVEAKFFVLSDLHFHISYEADFNATYLCQSKKTVWQSQDPVPTDNIQPIARPFCDSSLALISEVLSKVKEVDPNPDFILITGDFIGHFTSTLLDTYGNFNRGTNIELIKTSFSNIVKLLKEFFTDTQVIPLIGNNDVYIDYQMPEGYSRVTFLYFLYSLWEPLIHTVSPSFFLEGYYATTTSTGYNIILLNSVLFSIRQNEIIQGNIELLWLKSQLINKQKNIVVMHIPPGFSLYKGGSQSWYDHFSKEFIDLVNLYSSKIEIILAGHYHSGYFHLIDEIPIVVNPSVSPLFGNNPSFRYYDLKDNDFTEYNLNVYNLTDGWHSWTFSSVYGYPLNYLRLYNDINSGVVAIDKYMMRVTGMWFSEDFRQFQACSIVFGNACDRSLEDLKVLTLCDIKYLISIDYKKCIEKA